MLKRNRRAAIWVCATLIASTLAGGCKTDGSSGSSSTTAAAKEPVSLVVQMTGLLMIVPPKQGGKLTHVLMPATDSSHLAMIAFRQDTAASFCEPYIPEFGICLVDMTGWSLDSIGAGSAPGPASRLPRGMANLTEASGGRTVDLDSARGQIRAQVTLFPTQLADTCSLVRWTLNPVGSPAPARIPLINVIELQIPDLQADSLVLIRRRLTGSASPVKLATLRPVDGEIELLVLHLPAPEVRAMRAAASRSAEPAALNRTQDASPEVASASSFQAAQPGASSVSDEMEMHFGYFYDLLKADSTSRRLPRRPALIQDYCPITILGAADEVLESAMSLRPDLSTARLNFGTSTFSCVMTSAEQS